MSKFTILFRIGIIIFIVEGVIVFLFSLLEPLDSPIIEAISDASLTTLLTSFPIYFFVIKPYMEERVDLLLGVQDIFSGKEDSESGVD